LGWKNKQKVAKIEMVYLLILFFCSITFAQVNTFQEINCFPALEARQGVAVDEYYFYAIGSKSIGKYNKKTGALIKQWESQDNPSIIHLDSGVIVDGKLYCAHSNYPNLPMTSSIEIWDTASIEHIDSYSFGIADGSCTWIDLYQGFWWVCFAHYDTNGGYPEKE
jgi:hypothetical protein